jgi:hypothetical protein
VSLSTSHSWISSSHVPPFEMLGNLDRHTIDEEMEISPSLQLARSPG